jgi:hypothetical protein
VATGVADPALAFGGGRERYVFSVWGRKAATAAAGATSRKRAMRQQETPAMIAPKNGTYAVTTVMSAIVPTNGTSSAQAVPTTGTALLACLTPALTTFLTCWVPTAARW